jgi:hypothetical protein
MQTTISMKSQHNSHKARHARLIELLEKVDYALLGETTEIRYDLERIRKNTLAEIKEEQAIMSEIKLAAQKHKVSA